MTIQLIHDRGRIIKVETRPMVSEDVHMPKAKRLPQKPRYTKPEWKEVKLPKAHTGYTKGYIWDFGADQCRWVLNDKHLMCGKKQVGKSSYCEEHHPRTIDRTRLAKKNGKGK